MNTYCAGPDRRSIMTGGGHPNILPQDLSTVSNHDSLGHGSTPFMPLQPSYDPISPLYMSLPINEWPNMFAMQLHPFDLGRLDDPRSNQGQIIHSQQQGTSARRIKPRRLLTDKERREICDYYEQSVATTHKDTAGNL